MQKKFESAVFQKLLTVQDVAELLSCSVRQVQRLTKQSFLRCVRLNGSVRYRVEALDEDVKKFESAGLDLTILKRLKKAQNCLILDSNSSEQVNRLAEHTGSDPDRLLKQLIQEALSARKEAESSPKSGDVLP